MNTATSRSPGANWSGVDRRRIRSGESIDARIRRLGEAVFRYGLAAVFVWIGLLKFTAYEAKNIEPLVTNSPLWAWALQAIGLRGLSNVIGVVEILIGVLIAMRSVSPRMSMLGSVGAIVTFLITLSFMLTTPGVWEPGYGFGFLSALPGQFLTKDLVLLGVAVWTAGETLQAVRREARLAPTRSTGF